MNLSIFWSSLITALEAILSSFGSVPGSKKLSASSTEPRDQWFSGAALTAETVRLATLMPAERHFPTASGTAARGGSIMEMRPRKQSRSVGKFMPSQSKLKPRGNCDEDRLRWQKPAKQEEAVRSGKRREKLTLFGQENDRQRFLKRKVRMMECKSLEIVS